MSEKLTPQDKLPFDASGLVPLNGARSMVYRDDAHPGSVVRLSGEFGFGKTGKEKTKEIVRGLREARQLFDELEETYGIRTAGFRPVVGHYRGEQSGAIIQSDYVEGQKFTFGPDLPAEVQGAGIKLRDKLTHYLLDKHRTQRPLLSDIGAIEQYRYDPTTDEFILVDTDPYVSEGYVAEGMFLSNLSSWARGVTSPEAFEAWHESLVEQIKPVELTPSHA